MIIGKSNKNFMAFTNSYAFVIILLVVAASNLLWFLLLPAKGENHPAVKLITDIERTIKRAEDSSEANWSVMRKQIKKQKMQMQLLGVGDAFSQEEQKNVNKILEALLLYVDANWRLFEQDEDPEQVKVYYKKSLHTLDSIPQSSMKVTVELDKEGDTKEIGIGNSVAELKNLIVDQMQYLETNYGI
jgi:hypothetical protein